MSKQTQADGKVRTFSVLAEDVERLQRLRTKFARDGVILNNSEVVRLGLLLLEQGCDRDTLLARLARRAPGRRSAKGLSPEG